ncbi:MAG TPA: BatA domain-containing protein [Thermomonas sp.]|nr:BatA domain-containing protein [Thermomonas sp.]
MNVGLLLPSALLALAALLLPLLVHLVRQTEQTRIAFAAMRWLVARAQPRRRPRFNEWPLLLVRLLLLALLALWLAQPVLLDRVDARPWLVVHPAIDPARLPAAASPDEQRHWLAPGFPSLEQPAPATTASIGSLLRELDASLPPTASLRVVVPERFDATDAQRPRLGRAVAWLPIEGTSSFTAGIAPPPRLRVAVASDDAHRPASRYLRATAIAWASATRTPGPNDELREIGMDAALPPATTHLLWLGGAALPARHRQWVRDGGTALLAHDTPDNDLDWQQAEIAWRSRDGSPLALRMPDGKGAWIRMLVAFDPQSMPAVLEPGFPDALRALLAPAPVAQRTWAASYAPMQGRHTTFARTPHPLGPLLGLLVALLFGIERWLATAARRLVAR